MSTIGFDVGTGTLCLAKLTKDNKIELANMRNAFHPLSKEDLNFTQLTESKMTYVERKTKNSETDFCAIVGEDALKFGAMYGIEPKRPMKDGIISPQDIDSVDVINMMIEKLAGKTKDGICTYSVPAQPIDRRIA